MKWASSAVRPEGQPRLPTTRRHGRTPLDFARRTAIARQVHGDLNGLKPSQRQALEKLYKRRLRGSDILSGDLAAQITLLSHDLNRVVAILVDRTGNIDEVMVGDSQRVYLPDIGRQRAGASRFRGLRLIRTVLTRGRDLELTREDLADLSKLKLDLVMGVSVSAGGYPGPVVWAHLVPENPENKIWEIQRKPNPGAVDTDFGEFIAELEGEFQRKSSNVVKTSGPPVLLVYVAKPGAREEAQVIAEMYELCRTAGVSIIDSFVQRRQAVHPQFVVGAGKLEELTLRALQLDAEVIVFAQDLTPRQLRSITETTDLKVIDRTQLILDIFAQHATSRDGKIQVELAQLKYSLPRLGHKNTGMSRLTGGIGGRGPGETKLEINRRRAHDRIGQLERDILELGKQREIRRSRRTEANLPAVSIVGYTNAGKSTLLNTLTDANVLSEDKLFATLTPTSRRLRFPDEREIIFTDTVGFIHDLPQDLVAAFKATLEELDEADILLHVVDVSDENYEEKIRAVNRILGDIGLGKKEQLLVYNKTDLLTDGLGERIAANDGAIGVSALKRPSLRPLVEALETRLFFQNRAQRAATAQSQQGPDPY